MSTKFSVNVNKIALMRNARGANIPDVTQFALDCSRYGVDGITVHPRPDERHITRKDVYDLAAHFPTKNCEYNIEGYPTKDFLDMVCEVKPNQCTLVPDAPGQLTSDHGWDTIKNRDLLKDVIQQLHETGIRVSLFIDPINAHLEAAKKAGAERIEYYTGPYAFNYKKNREEAVKEMKDTALFCASIGLGVNAGHDLNLDNLKFLKESIPNLLEVSIGQAFVRDCLYFGLENTIHMYKRLLA